MTSVTLCLRGSLPTYNTCDISSWLLMTLREHDLLMPTFFRHLKGWRILFPVPDLGEGKHLLQFVVACRLLQRRTRLRKPASGRASWGLAFAMSLNAQGRAAKKAASIGIPAMCGVTLRRRRPSQQAGCLRSATPQLCGRTKRRWSVLLVASRGTRKLSVRGAVRKRTSRVRFTTGRRQLPTRCWTWCLLA